MPRRHKPKIGRDLDLPELDELDDNEMADYEEEDVKNRLDKDWEQASGIPRSERGSLNPKTNVTKSNKQKSKLRN